MEWEVHQDTQRTVLRGGQGRAAQSHVEKIPDPEERPSPVQARSGWSGEAGSDPVPPAPSCSEQKAPGDAPGR